MSSNTETERFGPFSNPFIAKVAAGFSIIGIAAGWGELFGYLNVESAILILMTSTTLGGLFATHALVMGWIPDE